jgi:hypothetical protein
VWGTLHNGECIAAAINQQGFSHEFCPDVTIVRFPVTKFDRSAESVRTRIASRIVDDGGGRLACRNTEVLAEQGRPGPATSSSSPSRAAWLPMWAVSGTVYWLTGPASRGSCLGRWFAAGSSRSITRAGCWSTWQCRPPRLRIDGHWPRPHPPAAGSRRPSTTNRVVRSLSCYGQHDTNEDMSGGVEGGPTASVRLDRHPGLPTRRLATGGPSPGPMSTAAEN